jgi:hypothetical protein
MLFMPIGRFPRAQAWIVVLVCALGWLTWADLRRIDRVSAVTAWGDVAPQPDSQSPTGFAQGRRRLIVPEHATRSYQWIAETQEMLARRAWRVRQVDYDNAPMGRDVAATSPYRWLLALGTWIDHVFTGKPIGQCVEDAALYVNPALHVLLLIGGTLAVARWLGSAAAGLFAVGMASFFPLASAFLPGAPDVFSASLFLAFWSVAPLVAAAKANAADGGRQTGTADLQRRRTALAMIAGTAGGLGLWMNASVQAPILLGLVLGGAALRWIKAARSEPDAVPWTAWSLVGAGISLVAYVVEYWPRHYALRLDANHPLFALAWLGAAMLLTNRRAQPAIRTATKTTSDTKPASTQTASTSPRYAWLALAIAVLAVAALPAAALWNRGVFLPTEPQSLRLAFLPETTLAKNFAAWTARAGGGLAWWASLAPLLLLAAVLRTVCERQNADLRPSVALCAGPLLVSLVWACQQLRWWSVVELLLLVLAAAVVERWIRDAKSTRPFEFFGWGLAGLAMALGAVAVARTTPKFVPGEFSRAELEGLLERDAAYWLVEHTGRESGSPIVLAPPERSTSLCYYGGMRGLGSSNWENRDGTAAAIQIVCANTSDEALALLNQRGVTHLVLPSWDSDLEEFTKLSMARPADSFIAAVQRWALPPWLQPLPYAMPAAAGFEGQTIRIFRVTEEADRAHALSRVADYFLEVQDLDGARAVAEALQPYPTKLAALVARAKVANARGDQAEWAKLKESITTSVRANGDRVLPWDRRVGLAVILALAEMPEQSKAQVRRCLAEANAERLRNLSAGDLYRLLVLAKKYQLDFAKAELGQTARDLLPREMRM